MFRSVFIMKKIFLLPTAIVVLALGGHDYELTAPLLISRCDLELFSVYKYL